MRIAALLTCHNRKEKTHDCLLSLDKIKTRHELVIYLTDDGSTDGTSEMISSEFPHVHLIHGDGNLFWSRGMYAAWKEALKGNYDFYLWLNDDVILYPYFLDESMECEKLLGGHSIITGLIEDATHCKIIYGGSDSSKKRIQATGKPEPVRNMNGNVVLVPKCVVDKIGIIDPRFHHDLGDVDYGLTASKNGIGVYTTRKAIASGYTNNYCRVRKWGTNVVNRFRKLYSPLGSNPSINFYFRKKHFGLINASTYWIYLHLLNIIPDGVVYTLWGDKYVDKP